MARILVIDDEAPIRRLLQQILEVEGHQVSTAADGEEGDQILDASPIDLVITDIFMPNKEGIETIQMVRKKSPRTKIVAISGEAASLPGYGVKLHINVLEAAKHLGAHRTLAKPFTLQEITEAVNALVPKHETNVFTAECL